MKRLFGTAPAKAGPAAPPPSLSDATQKMDSRVEHLDQKIAKCEEDLRRYMTPGKQNKSLAVATLKRKKMYEGQRDQMVATQFNIDCMAGAQEQMEVTVMSVEAMKAGQQDLKQRYAALGGIGEIEDMMDSMADLNDEIQDINEALATSYAVPDGFDEASCEAEFAALEEEMKMDALMGISAPSYLQQAAPAQPATATSAVEATAPAEATPQTASTQ